MKRLSKLAKDYNILASQIRYYVKEGLLSPSDKTQGGYMLFSQEDEERLKKIFELKKQRYTISEIRDMLNNNVI